MVDHCEAGFLSARAMDFGHPAVWRCRWPERVVWLSSLASSGALALDDGPVHWALLPSAVSYHQQRTHANRPYNETNVGLGLERRSPFAGLRTWELAVSASILQDSFDATSLFTVASVTHGVLVNRSFALRLGASAGLAYKHTQWDGPHKLVPYLAPTVILRAAGIGVQLSYAYRQNATTGRTNGVYSLQTSVAF
jgi:hypothetical protein